MDAQNPEPSPSSSLIYQYTPLQSQRSIRLIVLQPGSDPAPVAVSLKEGCIDDDLSYEAVSYTWATEDGNDERSNMILCDEAYIRVTLNCETVLRRFRDSTAERVLWVDAICINQEDIIERGQQVQLMGKIYSKACKVLIWLGEATTQEVIDETPMPASEYFFKWLHLIAEEIRLRKSSGQAIYEGPINQEFLRWRNEIDQNTETVDPLYQCLQGIFLRRWWKRLWVVQEAAVASSALLICGSATLDFSDLDQIHHCIREERSASSNASLTAYLFLSQAIVQLSIRKFLNDEFKRTDAMFAKLALHFLEASSRKEVSDPRDRVFGILGLVNRFGQIFPAPDYNKSVGTVFTEAAKAVITFGNSSEILCHSSGDSGRV